MPDASLARLTFAHAAVGLAPVPGGPPDYHNNLIGRPLLTTDSLPPPPGARKHHDRCEGAPRLELRNLCARAKRATTNRRTGAVHGANATDITGCVAAEEASLALFGRGRERCAPSK